MTRLILWLVLGAIVIRLAYTFIRSVLDGAGLLGGSQPTPSVKLVRDPVCGVYVVPGQALTSGSGNQLRYFCSDKCRRQWGRA